MKLADRGLNPQAEALEEAQTLIRLAVRDGWLANEPKPQINVLVQKIIRDALKQLKLRELREAAYRSLNAFAERQHQTYRREFGATPAYLLALIALTQDKPTTPEFKRAAEYMAQNAPLSFDMPTAADDGRTAYDEPVTYESDAHGSALQMYSQDYYNKYVMPAFDRILEQKALDPDDVSGTNSLRNRAEMEVRYARHLDEIAALRAAGVKLVTSSVHADCSDRCYKWQGQVYSLDGTSGTTEDGKKYVPLEKATDVYYTTHAGKTYKNGLFGFNCRHYIMEYKVGMVIPHVPRDKQQRESAINKRQRELERRVREQKEKALIFKNLNRERYLAARRKAIQANKEYIQFSKDNGRAYYPSRTKLI